MRSRAAIRVRLSPDEAVVLGHAYEVSGARLLCDEALGELAPFAVPSAPVPREPQRREPVAMESAATGDTVYAGPGWVGGELRQVECRRGAAGYRVRVEGAAELAVAGDGGSIEARADRAGGAHPAALVSAVLGPGLMLALALRGTWCLHAAAASPGREVVALAGDSGCGKSTLAAALANPATGWSRVADDLLPVRLTRGGLVALPRFPQPKLDAGKQWRAPRPAELSLAAVYVLEPGGASPRRRRLSERDAALALVRQTVAAKLFDADLQARHLDFCAAAARHLPLFALSYPRRRRMLPATVRLIAAAGA